MKSLKDKIISTGKKAVATTALALAPVLYSQGQDIDKTTLPGMDFYSQPMIVNEFPYGCGDNNKDGYINSADNAMYNTSAINDQMDVNGDGVVDLADKELHSKYLSGEISKLPGHWNKLNRTEKIDWLNKMLAIDKTDSYPYVYPTFSCVQFSFLTEFNFTGIENLENYPYLSSYDNLEYYTGKEINNGKFGIPIYDVSTITDPNSLGSNIQTEASGHRICGTFVGPENIEEKENPLDFKQWYFFEPQTDTKVVPGDFSMNKDAYAIIKWNGWRPNAIGTWKHSNDILIPFYLNNGEASYKDNEISPTMIKENPHELYVQGNDEEILLPKGTDSNSISPLTYGNLTFDTNSKIYSPVRGEMTQTSEEVTIDGVKYDKITQEQIAKMNVGRWTGAKKEKWNDFNLENLVDTARRVILIPANDTGFSEAEAQKGFDIETRNGFNGVQFNTFSSERGKVSLEVFNMAGQLVDQKYFDMDSQEQKKLEVNPNLPSGTYVVRGTLMKSDGKVAIDTEKFHINRKL